MQKKDIYILAIESSCDDTSVAVMRNHFVLSNITASQKIHEQYGGVVPELAGRDHEKNIVPVVSEALKKAGVEAKELDAVAVTSGPGLMGSLLVGISFAKSLSLALQIPLISVNHMQAHILAHFLEDEKGKKETPRFPFICLTVSGGHTQLVLVKDHFEFEVLGQTIDDAVGEAFDKAAKILGLPYPGGPFIDKYAREGERTRFNFAPSRVPNLDFSFSGIKTSFLYFIRDHVKEDPHFVEKNLIDICASYQEHLINSLLKTTAIALDKHKGCDLALAGGVSANGRLRERVAQLTESRKIKAFIPPLEYCTDNAAMIGAGAYIKFLRNEFSPLTLLPDVKMHL